jgi:hypothetical protein
MLRIGKGIRREAVRRALKRPGAAETVIYEDVLDAGDIRETVAGIRDAGTPRDAVPLLAWFASHPNTPEDVLLSLASEPRREVLISLAMNRKLPDQMRAPLMAHDDEDVREHALRTFRPRPRRH